MREFVLATIDKKGLFDESRLRKIFDIIDSVKRANLRIGQKRINICAGNEAMF